MVDTIYSHDDNFSLAAQYTFIEYTAANVLLFCETAPFFPSFFLSIITFIVSGNGVGVETITAVTAMMAAAVCIRVLNLSLNDNKTGVLLGGYRDNLYLCHIVIR